ncbi:DUF1937 family protein [Cypionkella sp.]|uniref:DUF1937 family protein n=1 Tax=Cypionkella sp. TaxID=2811411 RepID=UPI002ABCE1A1|nr:DUF1937 family protein [Cypionkella sp.]MDZ4393806.1 DUF1937 family protein [Cypionkella sp.]
MNAQPAWGPVLEASRRGDLPLLKVGMSPAQIGDWFGGRQPVYLATPYSKECTDMLGQWDYLLSCALGRRAEVAAKELMAHGVSAFAPIALAVGMISASCHYRRRRSERGSFEPSLDPLDAAAWSRWCQPFLNVCGAVVVPDIPGWDHSVGIWAEVQFAIGRGIPVFVYGGGS